MTRRSVLGLTAALLIPMATFAACSSDDDGPDPSTPLGSNVATSVTPTPGSAVDDQNGNGGNDDSGGAGQPPASGG